MSIIPVGVVSILNKMVHGSYYTANSILTALQQQSENDTLKAHEDPKKKGN